MRSTRFSSVKIWCLLVKRKEREKRGKGRRKENRKEKRDGKGQREKKKIGNEIKKKKD